ncbi:hypothetical protein SADUNF_Sadunf14G0139500 [Salix dunnii]|uniref:GPI transamidase component PIG-T n=1 Tax=Salix dunnii TaxID=1413687 RepID=A0A835JHY6_9ROSI|nr:hypothetical protein SADUNF_Sadunf14G0139500 [Salix dunnii]
MELPSRWAFLLFLLLSSTKAFGSDVDKEEFQEELLLKPLPDRKLLAHFHFETRAPPCDSNGLHHHHLFPKSISQMVEKFRVKEMELSFTQGRWNYERWGGSDTMASNNAKPPGVELWAVFDVPKEQVDASWKNLTHTLSGIFCASINFLESSSMYSAPDWSFRQASGSLRYGMLPREAVCTENLTPWLKLLPCRDKAGISALMDRPSIYTSLYYSQRLHLTSNASDLEGLDSGIVLEQTLTVVLHPSSQRTSLTHFSQSYLQPSWSLSSIFGRKVNGRCVLAKSSKVYLQLERGLVSQLKKSENYGADYIASEGYDGEANFELTVNPDRVHKEENSRNGISSSLLYEFSVDRYSNSKPFDLGLTWKFPVIWSCQQAPLHASRFLMGSGNERGAIAILLKSTDLNDSSPVANSARDGCELRVNIFQVVPWYIRVYYHSLQLFVDDQLKAVGAFVEKIHVIPSKDKISPGMMEMVLKLPCGVKSAALTIDFDKGFLHIDEYPPDANQGFDIPSAAIAFPDFHTSMLFHSNDSERKSPMLSKFQESSPVLLYTEVLLVPLTTPDFSMPYNVITITCTVFALYFGSLLNVLRERVGEKERLLKSKAAANTGLLSELLSRLSAKLRGRSQEPMQSPSKLSPLINSKLALKVLLMAALAVAWQYYFG